MTDLVKRLREYYDPGDDYYTPHDLLDEAADEIERLRKALDSAYYVMAFSVGDLAGHADPILDARSKKLAEAADNARKALEGKDD